MVVWGCGQAAETFDLFLPLFSAGVGDEDGAVVAVPAAAELEVERRGVADRAGERSEALSKFSDAYEQCDMTRCL